MTRAPGYLIEVSEDELDATRFERLGRDTDDAVRAGRWAEAGHTAATALGLWRGTPLADVSSQLLKDRWGAYLEETRVQVLEWRIESDLQQGRHERLISELRDVIIRHPLKEHFHAQLLLALARAGRQAEALAAYQQARAALVSELGIEPGPELRQLHERILAGDTALVTPPAARNQAVVPRELPGTVRHFTGRETELAELTTLAGTATDHPGTLVISAIGGTAGVGKTALAVHWAHQVAGRFPDGQLCVNLRGYDPGQPMPAADALAGFLRALGVPGQDIPADAGQRAARYRSLLAGRRVLVVLDNAGSPEQIRPLLPAAPGCVTVVTSRDSLPGLVARDGAVRLELDVLPTAEAVGLLRVLVGARVDAEPEATQALAEQCCRLPLALRIAAEFAIARPDASLARLAEELADQQQRLSLLEAGADPRTAVRAVFSWSYQRLDPDTARMFRLLGLHPGPDFDTYAAAALAGNAIDQAERLLLSLARAYLIHPTASGRYVMHDLLRAYACGRAAAIDGDEGRTAQTRMLDHYLYTAAIAVDVLFPADRHLRPRIPAVCSPAPFTAEPDTAQAWLGQELANLVAVSAHAAENGWPGHAKRLSATLFRYLYGAGHTSEAIIVHGRALDVARREGDSGAEANALRNLGDTHLAQGRHRRAFDYLTHALALFRAGDDQVGEGRALGSIGLLHLNDGHFQQAVSCLEESLVLLRKAGEMFGVARVLGNLGAAKRNLGRATEAAVHYQEALALAREIGDQSGQAQTLCRLGILNRRRGLYQQAAAQFQEALTLFRQVEEPSGVAEALLSLGELSTQQERYRQAADQLGQSLSLFREVGDKQGEATVLNRLGDVCLRAGQHADAHAWHAAALEIAAQIEMLNEVARAHQGLARCCHTVGDSTQARRHWQEALGIFTDIGAPEAEQVRTELAAASGPGDSTQQPSRSTL